MKNTIILNHLMTTLTQQLDKTTEPITRFELEHRIRDTKQQLTEAEQSEKECYGMTQLEIEQMLDGLFTPAPQRYHTHAMSVLSDVQETLHFGEGSAASVERARQMLNVAKYILCKLDGIVKGN